MKYIVIAGLATVASGAVLNCKSNADCAPDGAGYKCV